MWLCRPGYHSCCWSLRPCGQQKRVLGEHDQERPARAPDHAGCGRRSSCWIQPLALLDTPSLQWPGCYAGAHRRPGIQVSSWQCLARIQSAPATLESCSSTRSHGIIFAVVLIACRRLVSLASASSCTWADDQDLTTNCELPLLM